MKRRLPRDQEKKLADDAMLARQWRVWHHEQLTTALKGEHSAVVAAIMAELNRLDLQRGAGDLLACVERIDWSAIDFDVRLTILHQVNDAITRFRERAGLDCISDPLPGQPLTAFWLVKRALFS